MTRNEAIKLAIEALDHAAWRATGDAQERRRTPGTDPHITKEVELRAARYYEAKQLLKEGEN